MTEKRPTNRTDAVSVCRERQREIKHILAAIEMCVDEQTRAVMRSAGRDAPWAHAGDLGEVKSRLEAVLAFQQS